MPLESQVLDASNGNNHSVYVIVPSLERNIPHVPLVAAETILGMRGKRGTVKLGMSRYKLSVLNVEIYQNVVDERLEVVP